MQEEIEQKSFNIMISTTKLSARTVLNAVKAAIRLYQSKASQGKQSVRTLLRQNRGVSKIRKLDLCVVANLYISRLPARGEIREGVNDECAMYNKTPLDKRIVYTYYILNTANNPSIITIEG